MARLLLIAGVLALLGACATDRPHEFACNRFMEDFTVTVDETPPRPPGAIGPLAETRTLDDVFAAALSNKLGPLSAEPMNVLVLSGGGQNGAFGSSFLKGWSAHGAQFGAPRPERFDMVTGVSSGSLQATYAFFGKGLVPAPIAERMKATNQRYRDAGRAPLYRIKTADGWAEPQWDRLTWDDLLVSMFEMQKESDLVKRRGLTFFLSHASMSDLSPLDQIVRDRTRDMMPLVREQVGDGQLLAGFVNMEDGRVYAADLGRIARAPMSEEERVECYAGSLLASSAQPIFHKQVTVGGKPLVDGGVRQAVFVTQVQQAAEKAHRDRAVGGPEGRLWIIMNGNRSIGTFALKDKEAALDKTAGRLKQMVFDQIEATSIYNVARKLEGMEARLAMMPAGLCREVKTGDDFTQFDPPYMDCVRDATQKAWESGSGWEVYPKR